MMVKLSERWLPALCLAILLHVTFFSVLYTNFRQVESTERAPHTATSIDTKIEAQRHLTSPLINEDLLIENMPKRVMTLDDTKKVERIKPNDKVAAINVQKPIAKNSVLQEAKSPQPKTSEQQTITIKTEVTTKRDNTELPVVKPKLSPSISTQNKTTQTGNASLKTTTQAIDPQDSAQRKRELGLLAGDIALQNTSMTIDTDKTYHSMKSEVESINDELRTAINEVKHRNQSKIEQAQPQKAAPQPVQKISAQSGISIDRTEYKSADNDVLQPSL